MRYHVIDDHCNIIGGEDFGAVDTSEEAAAKINEQKARGNKGGCRCSGSGWRIMTCDERQKHMEKMWERYPIFMLPDTHECREYNQKSFEDAYSEMIERENEKTTIRPRKLTHDDLFDLYDGESIIWDKEK